MGIGKFPEYEQTQVPQLRRGHRQCPSGPRRAGHQPGEDSGCAPECKKGRLAEGQAEEKAARLTAQERFSENQRRRPSVRRHE